MNTFQVQVNGHQIEIRYSLWSGMESIFYDGRQVSKKRSFLYLTPHSFKMEENGAEAVYEVNVLTGWGSYGYIIRRNGIIVAHEP